MRRFARLAVILIAAGCSKPPEPNIRTVAADAFEKPAPVANADGEAAPPAPNEDEPVQEAVEGVLQLPQDGVWPWPVGAAPKSSGVVPLTHLIAPGMSLHNAAVNPIAGKAVVFLWESNFKQKTSGTRVLWCDLAAGQVKLHWDMPGRYCGVFDLSADGQQMLVRRSDLSGWDHDRLEVWEIASDGRLVRRDWCPYWTGHAADGERRVNESPNAQNKLATVRWAGFAGPDRIVTVCGVQWNHKRKETGELKVWERDGKVFKQCGVFDGVLGLPAVTPDGKHVAFAAGESVYLLDPLAGKVIGERRLGAVPKDPVLAWHDSGTKLAVAGKGRVAVIDLAANRTWDAMVSELTLETQLLVPSFGWAGNNAVFCNGMLYDLFLPIRAWQYHSHTFWASPRGGRLWAVVQALGEQEVALRSFALPHPSAERAIDRARQRSDLFALRPGDPVRIDVSSLPANKQNDVKATLERRVKELGYRLDPQAPTTFTASADSTGRKVSKTYSIGKRSVTGTYVERFARLKVIRGGRVLWEALGSDTPCLLIVIPGGVDPAEYIGRFGSPDYGMFNHRPLPGVIRAAGVDAKPLGDSTLAASGLRDK